MNKFVPEALRAAAGIYEERNKLYGDTYKKAGAVMHALFAGDIPTRKGQGNVDWNNRLGVLTMIVGKLTRYCANFDKGGHADSLDDLAVYAMMLRELDCDIKPMTQNEIDIETYGYEGVG